MATKKKKISAQNSAKRGRKAPREAKRITQNSDSRRGKNPKSLANLQPFKSKEELGGQLDTRINVGGRPKALGESYKKVLESEYPQDELDDGEKKRVRFYAGNDDAKVSHAEIIALRMVRMAAHGDVRAASELRVATEGDKLRLETWQTELVDALKRGTLTPQELVDELGIDNARPILVAAGTTLVPQAQAPAAPRDDAP